MNNLVVEADWKNRRREKKKKDTIVASFPVAN